MLEVKDIKLLKVVQVDEDKYKDYLVYLYETEDTYEMYLTNKKYGIMCLVMGVNKVINPDKLLDFNFLEDIEYYRDNFEDYEVVLC